MVTSTLTCFWGFFGSLRIAPVLEEKHVVRREVIEYDSALLRRFFRAYLAGCEFITIKLTKDFKPADRKALLDFIHNNLMNVEVIEEAKDKIVVQNFKLALLIKKSRSCILSKLFLPHLPQ
jgi:hypothetical protein